MKLEFDIKSTGDGSANVICKSLSLLCQIAWKTEDQKQKLIEAAKEAILLHRVSDENLR